MSGSGGRAVDGRWTGCGRAGAAEIAWEDEIGGRAVDGRWTGCGRAGAAEIAWEEARKVESCQFFGKKRDSTFGLFWLWEETGYVWDVVAGVLL